ncbi:DUF6488 family protein [Desulfosarcina sp.]|uniref:DUF6488 family protein n=1 Tax=Desulfosarcina sp. TaxID=2027861 RepID=UPI003565C86B
MIKANRNLNLRPMLIAVLIAAGLIISGPGGAYSHGGKTHTENPFSALEAVQKATQLFDRLIVSGKLPEAWETGLSSIHVSVRSTENNRETVVQFKRSGGDPESVYFYFDRQGEYSGSNFSGE